eukprot:654710-Prorocentrum_lima.AAC.1
MVGEVRLTCQEEHAAISFRATTAAGPVARPIPKGQGMCNKFLTEQGCSLGKTCPYEHPKDSPKA